MTKRTKLDELIEMCFYGHLDQVENLLKEGVNINGIHRNGMNALMAALGGDNYDIVKILVKHGADLNNLDWTILHETIDYAIDGMIQDKLDKPNSEVMELIKFLIENGADLNQKDVKGRIPLDSLKIYSGNLKNFNKLKEIFREVIPEIDENIKY